MKKALFLCCVAIAAAGCNLFVDKNTHDYPQASKDAFMKSCMENSGGQEAPCACMLAKVQEKYTYGEVAAIEERIKKGEQVPEMTEFMTKTTEACAEQGQR